MLLPVVELSNTQMEGTDEAPSSWVQCAKAGKFYSKRYKQFEINDQTFQELAANFDVEVVADYDHYSTLPLEKRPAPDAGEAAGWVKKVEQRGSTFWAFVEWTKKAAQQIRDKRFKYISPTIDPTALSTEGEPRPLGSKLVAIALTNQPFLSGMQAVMLSRAGVEVTELSADISLDDKRSRIAQAFYQQYQGDFESPYIDPGGIYDDYIICRKAGKLWKVPFSSDETFQSFEFGEPVEVVPSFTELSSEPQGEIMPTETTNTETQTPPAQDPVMLNRLTAIETENANLKLELSKQKATTEVDALIRGGKMLKSQRDWAIEYAVKDPTGFTKYAGTLKPLLALNKEHGSGEGADVEVEETLQTRELSGDRAAAEAIVNKFTDLVLKYKTDNKCSTSEALRVVQTDNLELANDYVSAMQELSSLND